jgi:dihydrofolate reductase
MLVSTGVVGFAAHYSEVDQSGDDIGHHVVAFQSVPEFLSHYPKLLQRIGGNIVDEVRRLKASAGPALHIWGSHKLLQTLIAAELVDEYRMLVYPMLLGKGKRLFENNVPPGGLTLVNTRSTPKGVLFNTYRSAAPV